VQAFIAHSRKAEGSMAQEQKLLVMAKRKREELRLRQSEGELIDRREAQQQAFDVGRHTRDSLLAIPDRLAGLLASELDQTSCHRLLMTELLHVCEGLSSWCLTAGTPTRENGKDHDARLAAHPTR
jgi:hypothetical protein